MVVVVLVVLVEVDGMELIVYTVKVEEKAVTVGTVTVTVFVMATEEMAVAVMTVVSGAVLGSICEQMTSSDDVHAARKGASVTKAVQTPLIQFLEVGIVSKEYIKFKLMFDGTFGF